MKRKLVQLTNLSRSWLALSLLSQLALLAATPRSVKVRRLAGNPIIRPEMLPGQDGANINGPSLIRTPDWLANRLVGCISFTRSPESRALASRR